MKEVFFELVGPDYELARAEILSAIDALSYDHRLEKSDRGLVSLSTDCPVETLGSRLGLTHRIYEQIGVLNDGGFEDLKQKIDLPPGSAAVRTRKIEGETADSKKIKRELGSMISTTNPIDLDSPDHEITVLVSDEMYIGRKIFERDPQDFRPREVKNRPFSSPISLKPRYTRALINLARPGKDARLHDPFCGTGGLLIEASKMGFRPSGGDIDQDMIEGCRRNLQEFEVEAPLEVGDVSKNIPEDVDVIVTDPPYGRASSTSKEELLPIYRRLFERSESILSKGSHLSAVFPEESHVSLGEEYLELIEEHKVRVHGSLNRHFTAFKKQ